MFASKIDGSQPAIACSKLAIETLEQGVKYVNTTPCFSISVGNFEQVNSDWVVWRVYGSFFSAEMYARGLPMSFNMTHLAFYHFYLQCFRVNFVQCFYLVRS